VNEYSLKYLIWTFMLEILLIVCLAPTSWIQKTAKSEAQMIYDYLGTDTLQHVHTKSVLWYRDLFQRTGIERSVREIMLPAPSDRPKKGMDAIGEKVFFPYIRDRGEAVSDLLHQLLRRLAILLVWLPFILIVSIPAFWDGYMSWKIKRTNFAYTSPFIHKYGSKLSGTLILIALISLFAPIAIPPMLLPMLAMALVITMGIFMVSNMPKQV
tara:strand:- start:2120 stop:2755 length:636 start_codon:yes stop_codon:yes gene_type:complete